MSHSSGTVTFEDGTVMHCEYNGTSDIMIPALYPTEDELSANWRNHEWKECKCGKLEPCVIYSSYGGGFEWDGKACRECRAIDHAELIYTDFRPSEDDYGWGY